MGEIDGVLHDVDLVFKFRLDIDCGVGDEQGARIGRSVHDEDVGDPARSAQAGVALHGGFHQLVGVQAALHHRLGVSAAAHGHAELRRLALGVRLQVGTIC